MVSIQESTAEELEAIAEDNDLELDSVRETFKEKYEDIEGRSDWSDTKIEQFALRLTRTNALKRSRVNSDEVEMLVIGGEVRNGRNGDYFNGTALVDEEPEEDGGRPKLGEVIVNDDNLIHDIYEAFNQVGNIVRGEFSVSEGDLENHLRLFAVDETEVEVNRPDDREGLYEEIRKIVPEFNISNIADNLSSQTRTEDGDIYTVTSDIRRIEGDIYDGYKNPDKGIGTYTIRDETVFDEEDIVESPVHNPDPEEQNENATPGLTCWTDPNKMEYGTESVCEFYGTLSRNDDEEITMSVHGIVPVFTNEYDGFTDDSSDESNEQVDTSNVDRTEI